MGAPTLEKPSAMGARWQAHARADCEETQRPAVAFSQGVGPFDPPIKAGKISRGVIHLRRAARDEAYLLSCGYDFKFIMSKDLYVILSRANKKDGAPAPIGSRADIVKSLSLRNTAAEVEGGDMLYGPGIEIELPQNEDPVSQMLLTISDDDIAWVVIMKLAKELQWKIFDPASGRELSP